MGHTLLAYTSTDMNDGWGSSIASTEICFWPKPKDPLPKISSEHHVMTSLHRDIRSMEPSRTPLIHSSTLYQRKQLVCSDHISPQWEPSQSQRLSGKKHSTEEMIWAAEGRAPSNQCLQSLIMKLSLLYMSVCHVSMCIKILSSKNSNIRYIRSCMDNTWSPRHCDCTVNRKKLFSIPLLWMLIVTTEEELNTNSCFHMNNGWNEVCTIKRGR